MDHETTPDRCRLVFKLSHRHPSPPPVLLTTCCSLEHVDIVFKWREEDNKPLAGAIHTLKYLTHLNTPRLTSHFTKTFLLANSSSSSTTTTTTTTTHPLLTHLSLHDCETVDDTTWIPYVNTHPHLQHIHLASSVWGTTNTSFQWTDTSLGAMATRLSQLQQLTLAYANNITPQGIRRLVRDGPSTLDMIQCIGCNGMTKRDFSERWNNVDNNNNSNNTMVTLDRLEMDMIKQVFQQRE